MPQTPENSTLRNRRLADQAIDVARDKIVANLRFMDAAVFVLKSDVAEYGIHTDGTRIYYEARAVLRRAGLGISEVTHDYMHVLLHCIFKHYYVRGPVIPCYWDLACDIAVEEVIRSLKLPCLGSERKNKIRDELRKLRPVIGALTAERVYRYLVSNRVRENKRKNLEAVFHVDEHDMWYEAAELPIIEGDEDSTSDNTTNEVSDDGSSDAYSPDDEDNIEENIPAKGQGSELDTEPDWDQIGQMVRSAVISSVEDLHSMHKLLDTLEAMMDKTIEYRDFLRRFATRKEALKTDDSSFDYIFYHYGMELYGDMPLIEPLEYGDDRKVRDIVIVIDSSASTEGEVVEQFVEQTFDILLASQDINNRFNVRLIQCDDKIREDVVLHTRAEAYEYLKTMQIRGGGGTDFRSAFQYVDELIRNGEVRHLRGLIYFTDGRGIYPKKKPKYDTAFVMDSRENASMIDVPPWAMKVVLGGMI